MATKSVVKKISHLSMAHCKKHTLRSWETALTQYSSALIRYWKRHIRGIREYKKGKESSVNVMEVTWVWIFTTSLQTEPETLTAVETCILWQFMLPPNVERLCCGKLSGVDILSALLPSWSHPEQQGIVFLEPDPPHLPLLFPPFGCLCCWQDCRHLAGSFSSKEVLLC